jgi:hypothetical protein
MNENTVFFERLHAVAKQIVDDPGSAAGLKAELVAATMNLASRYDDPTQALKNLYNDETEFGESLRAAVAIVTEADGGDDDADEIAKARPRDSAAGAHGLAAALSEHLIDRLSSLRRRHGFEKTATKDHPPMDTLTEIMKSGGGIAGVCAAIVAKGHTSFTEAELVSAASAVAVERWPELSLSPAQAFSRVYSAGTEEARILQHALSVAKAGELGAFNVTQVGGTDAQALDDPQAALAQLAELGQQRWPNERPDVQFARAFGLRPDLAVKAHRRPSPTTSYAMPHASPGSAYAKADPAPEADSAYSSLMVKARDYQTAHPELSEAQCFAKIYTDRGNVELAKRERLESAPR